MAGPLSIKKLVTNPLDVNLRRKLIPKIYFYTALIHWLISLFLNKLKR